MSIGVRWHILEEGAFLVYIYLWHNGEDVWVFKALFLGVGQLAPFHLWQNGKIVGGSELSGYWPDGCSGSGGTGATIKRTGQ